MRGALTGLALAALAILASGQEVLTESWSDGSPKVRREIRRDAAGEPVAHGAYKRWHKTGKVAETGTYADGLRVGEWVFRWESGRRKAQGAFLADAREGEWKLYSAKGRKAAQGTYKRGLRDGQWTFWAEKGGIDAARSGFYRSQLVPEGGAGWEGESRDGLREGRWILYRAGRRPMMQGDYAAGLPEGPWISLHADGTLEEWFTGEYEGGTRVGRLTVPPAGFTRVEREPDRARVPRPATSERMDALLDAFLTGPRGEQGGARAAMLAEPREALPSALAWLLACNLASVREQAQARRVHSELVAAIFGAPLPWSQSTRADDVADNTRTILRWHTLWELVADREHIWRGELDPKWRWIPVDRSYTIVEHPPAPEGFLPSAGTEDAARDGDPTTDAPLANALAWLAQEQAPEGTWRPSTHGGDDEVAIGVACACLLAFLRNENTPLGGEHAAVVERGLKWLAVHQNLGSGVLSTSPLEGTYEHVLGTWVLSEATARTGLPVLRQSLRRAVDYLSAAQRFDGAWPRNTAATEGHAVVTAEALIALRSARAAGVEVEEPVLANALSWLRRRTDRSTGETAGDLGALAPRTSAAATAAALVARVLAGPAPDEDPLVERQALWLAGHVPVVFPDLDESDPHYVFLGSFAAALLPGRGWDEWRTAAHKVLLASQIDRGELAGAWDVRGRHGNAGGRLWATAMSVLALGERE